MPTTIEKVEELIHLEQVVPMNDEGRPATNNLTKAAKTFPTELFSPSVVVITTKASCVCIFGKWNDTGFKIKFAQGGKEYPVEKFDRSTVQK